MAGEQHERPVAARCAGQHAGVAASRAPRRRARQDVRRRARASSRDSDGMSMSSSVRAASRSRRARRRRHAPDSIVDARALLRRSTSPRRPADQQLVHAARAPRRRRRRARRDVLRAGRRRAVARTVLGLRRRGGRRRSTRRRAGGSTCSPPGAPLRARLGAARRAATSASRVCDALLFRRGLPLYPVPAAGQALARWEAGWTRLRAVRRARRRSGCSGPTARRASRAPVGDGALRFGRVCETYPDAVFCALLGHRPSPKRTPWGLQQRIAALRLRGVVDDDGGLWHRTLDELDACAAAYAAYALGRRARLVGRRPARGRDRRCPSSARRPLREAAAAARAAPLASAAARRRPSSTLMTAVAASPGLRASSSAASRVISDTIAVRAAGHVDLRHDAVAAHARGRCPAGGCARSTPPVRAARAAAARARRTHVALLAAALERTRPSRSQRRRVSMLTPSAVAAAPMRISRHGHRDVATASRRLTGAGSCSPWQEARRL